MGKKLVAVVCHTINSNMAASKSNWRFEGCSIQRKFIDIEILEVGTF